MKKILVTGDVHANYPALEAIQNYVRSDRFDTIVNTGDFTVYNTFPNETIQWFREKTNVISILGNTDRLVLRILKGKKNSIPGKEEKRIMYFWTSENLLPNAPESRFRQLAKDSPYRINIMGHSHLPFYKIFDGIHFINPGSVGRMFDGGQRDKKK